jgi:hypothetical protein
MLRNNVAIVISSFDGYEDLWKPLEQTYRLFWSDCPYKCYVTTNFKKPKFDFFNYISVGEDKSWSDMLIKSIDSIEEEYILLTFDDLFLYKNINTKDVEKYINYIIKNDINYFQLYSSISENTFVTDNIVSKNKNSKYRNATVWSLWKKEVLLDLLEESENAWEFEDKGSLRSNKYDKFYCVSMPVIPYLNGVVKGKWVPSVVRKLEKEGIDLNIEDRDIMTNAEFFIYKCKYFLYDAYKYLLFVGKKG